MVIPRSQCRPGGASAHHTAQHDSDGKSAEEQPDADRGKQYQRPA